MSKSTTGSKMGTLGVDPGMNGAFALLEDGVVDAWEFKGLTEKDMFELLRSLAPTIDRAYLEDVHSMPGQGVSSTFKFGQSFGAVRMALIAAGISFELVAPQKWKGAMGLVKRKGMTQTAFKNLSKARAQQLFAGTKITHANSEAILLAEYGDRLHRRG